MIFMIILLIALILIGALIVKKVDEYSNLNTIGSLSIMLFSVLLLVAAIMWPSSYLSYKAEINKYDVTKQTIMESRNAGIGDIERAALTTKIIDINQDIADAKFWNDTIFGDMIPDGYADLEFLK